MITQLEREVAKLKQGDHVCPVYEILAQQLAAATPFIKLGIENGERVHYGASALSLRRITEALARAGVDVDRECRRGTLQLTDTGQAPLCTGKFDPQAVIGRLHHCEMAALAAGFSGVRFIGDMVWSVGSDFNGDDLVEYEALLNAYVAGSRAVVLCQYDRTRFDPALIHDILRVHPIAILGDLVCQNPYCEPPELVIRREQSESNEYKRKRLDWWINRLKEVARRDQEAQRVRREMESLLDSAGEGICGIDIEGRCTFVNRAAVEMLGYDSEQIMGKNVHALIHHHHPAGPVYPPEQCPIFRSLQRNERCRVDDEVFWRADGVWFPVEYSACPIVENGVVTGGVVTFADTTERKRAQERIEEQAALLDQARDAVSVRDLEGKVLFWSKGAERIYGWTFEEVIGQSIGERLFLDWQEFEEANRLLLHQGEWHGEVAHRTKDCRELTVEARWALVRDKDGQPRSVLAINTDITEKKKLEARLIRSQRMESIGALAGGVAHDLNNILTPILTSIAVLQFKVTDPKARRILETIEVSSKRGADIVRQVLSFGRGLESARVEVQPKRLFQDIKTIIEDTFPKNIRLELPAVNGSWAILGDATQLLQVLLNLCVNARDAMPSGGSLVITAKNTVVDSQYASMHPHAKPGRYVAIGVADSGTGISPEIIDKIFEPFFTTKEAGKGTGLGLSTVLAIVKGHDGFIDVSSEPGQGTAFRVCLPVAGAFPESRKEIVPEAAPRGNGETILLVDDEASILAITSQTLEAFGYRTLMANDGVEAVTIYARKRDEIAAVLTDISMPVMDGGTTIRVLMKMNPAIKIIAASGKNAEGGAASGSEASVKEFLSKPYTAEMLLKALRKVLDED